jgi:serine/threonine protein kinase
MPLYYDRYHYLVYMAPEVMEQAGGYDFHADIWSVGIAALELAKGVAPYAHLSAMRVLVLTIEEPPPSLKAYPNDRQRDGAHFSSNFDDFYKKCLQKSPRLRPSTEELLKHKFLKNRSCYALVDQLLKHIPSVGQSCSTRPSGEELRRRLLPGEGPVAIELIERRPSDAEEYIANGTPKSHAANGIRNGSTNGSDSSSGKMPAPHPISPSPNSPANRVKPAPPVYVSGTTWVFDGDDDQGSIGNSGEIHRILRVSSRTLGKSSSKPNVLPSTSSFSSSSTSSSSHARGDDSHNNGIDSFLADFEADAATIKSTKSSVKQNEDPQAPANETPPIPQPAATTLHDNIVVADDNDAFMDEMEGICERDN